MPLRGSVPYFQELYLRIKLSDVREWSKLGGFDFVDLKCVENNCVVTLILANSETKSTKHLQHHRAR